MTNLGFSGDTWGERQDEGTILIAVPHVKLDRKGLTYSFGIYSLFFFVKHHLEK
jgi:hypothetical protein